MTHTRFNVPQKHTSWPGVSSTSALIGCFFLVLQLLTVDSLPILSLYIRENCNWIMNIIYSIIFCSWTLLLLWLFFLLCLVQSIPNHNHLGGKCFAPLFFPLNTISPVMSAWTSRPWIIIVLCVYCIVALVSQCCVCVCTLCRPMHCASVLCIASWCFGKHFLCAYTGKKVEW